jgi:ATP/maltotriose-dependent transcriptional regulator MalT
MYARLRRHASFIVPESATTFAYHDLFRDFLQHRLRLQGPQAYRRAQLAAAALLEAADRVDVALRLRVAATDQAGIVRLLRAQELKSKLSGMVDAIEEAFLSLPQAVIGGDAALLGLLARTRELRSAYEESDTLYEAAMKLAETTDHRVRLAMWYCGSLNTRRGHEAAFAVVRDVDPEQIEDLATRARLLSHLAVLQAMRSEFEEAERLADDALAATVAGDADSRADVLYLTCLASHQSNRVAEARTRGAEALRVAQLAENSYLITRCCHILRVLAVNDGDWERAARLNAEMLVHAKREGDVAAENIALRTSLFLATIRGEGVGIAQTEALLRRGPGQHLDFDGIYLAFVRAMRLGCSADFGEARREAENGLQTQEGKKSSYQILALPHLAVYQAAAGDRDAARDTLSRATTTLTGFGASGIRGTYATLVNIGRVLLAVAHALLLRSRAASEILSQLEQSEPRPIAAVDALAQAARTFNRVAQGAEERDALDRDLAKVRDLGLGGYADLLAALPAGIAGSAAAFGTLTRAELQMLRLVARGGTMKAIAVELNRSPDTVETHVRAVLRKLGCKRRSEAIALARDHGII